MRSWNDRFRYIETTECPVLGTLINHFRSPVSLLRDGDSLLLSQTEFNREISRERIRATRRSIPFCIVAIQLLGLKQRRARRKSLVRLLHRNLRLTDQKADLGGNRFGILLVDTPEMGGRAVLDRLAGLCETRNLQVSLTLKVHDPNGFDPDDDHDLPTGDGQRRREDVGDSKWIRVDSGDISSSGIATPIAESSFAMGSFETTASNEGGVAVSPTQTVTTTLRSNRTSTCVSSEEALVPVPLRKRLLKRSVDLVGASAGLALLSPLVIGSMIAVKLTSPGPAVFAQTREGRGGKPFTIYKLRTMCIDAESKQSELREKSHRDGPAFKITNDPRVTRVGRFLRKTCMDELPQLINVIKGEMSLVGPRPLPWHESRACSHWHRRRLDVRPGMTCYWQVNKAAAETFDDWMRMDLRYVDRNSLWQDLRLIFSTVIVPLTGRGSE